MKNNNKDPLAKLIESNPCGKCRAKRLPVCKCAGAAGGGGGSGGGGSEASSSSEDKLDLQAEKKSFAFDDDLDVKARKNNYLSGQDQITGSLDKAIDDNSIKKLFSIKLDITKGILSLKCKPGLSKKEKEEVKKLFKKIATAFDEFKENLKSSGVSVKGYNIEVTDDSITINIPDKKHFKDFIKLLAGKNIINFADLAKLESDQTKNKEEHFNPSPFRTRPTPKGYDD